MDTYVYAMDEFKAVFASAGLTATLLIFLVDWLKARLPDVLYGERTTLVTLLGGPVLMVSARALGWIPDAALTWQGAIGVGIQVSVMAMGGHVTLKTLAESRETKQVAAAKKKAADAERKAARTKAARAAMAEPEPLGRGLNGKASS